MGSIFSIETCYFQYHSHQPTSSETTDMTSCLMQSPPESQPGFQNWVPKIGNRKTLVQCSHKRCTMIAVLTFLGGLDFVFGLKSGSDNRTIGEKIGSDLLIL